MGAVMRAIIKLNDNTYINIPANYIATQDGFVKVWLGEDLVAMVRQDEVISCHLSGKKE